MPDPVHGYKRTLNLPQTAFPMKADLPQREPAMLARWQAMDLYGAIRKARAGAEKFVLHDGPPYANGDIHIGHALNKILKDVIVRYKTMRGFDSPYVPGWDCHGMPIEHQLFKELKLTKAQIGQTEFRAKARAYAERYVGIQREQFQRLGVLGDWQRPYLTMAPAYELTILRVFRELAAAGYIYHGKKPVYWCATCETAEAEAEVEYEDRQDTSIYVKFPVVTPPRPAHGTTGGASGLPEDVQSLFAHPEQLAVAVWTTTPWTLPANVALSFNPHAVYVVLRAEGWAHDLILSADLAPKVSQLLSVHPEELGRFEGRQVAGLTCRSPLTSRPSVAVLDDGVSMAEGTGVVHIAPGHGQEDFLIGQREKLETLSPVDHQGRFTADVPDYAGVPVFEANPRIIQRLAKDGLLLCQEAIAHSYPHCWRCKHPVIFRATPQWFLSVEAHGLRGRLLEAARAVEWIPPVGLNRMTGMLQTRPDWCLSRQRYWGTPIPVFHCAACGRALLDASLLQQVESALEARGVDAWFTVPPDELAPGAKCPCGGTELKKDTNILDVWFDSGVSYEAVLAARLPLDSARGGRPEPVEGWPELSWPAAMYLEGSDQHRGWFQVSLIPSVALKRRPPYRRVLTHGFVVDGEGRKMSKSLGNVVAPQEVMQRYGADILRLWVASVDYREDVRISEPILQQVAEMYRKLRNTFRYLLANLNGYRPPPSGPAAGGAGRLPLDEMPELDRWALDRARELHAEATRAYEAYEFHEMLRAVYQYCVQDLSGFYLDALKDRLYTEAAQSPERRCAQHVMYVILDLLVRALAPVTSVTCEEVWGEMRAAGCVTEPSVHLAAWPAAPSGGLDTAGQARWARFRAVREAVMKALEEQRIARVIGSPLEARVTLDADAELARLCGAHRDALAEAFVVSEVEVRTGGGAGAGTEVQGLRGVQVTRAPGAKCARCWKHLTSVGEDPAHPALCGRCARVVATTTV